MRNDNYICHTPGVKGQKTVWNDKKLLLLLFFIFKLGFTPCKAKQPLRGMELQEKKHKKDYRIQKICLETTYC